MKLALCILSAFALAGAACSRSPMPEADAQRPSVTKPGATGPDVTERSAPVPAAPEVAAPKPAGPEAAAPKEAPMPEKEPFRAGEGVDIVTKEFERVAKSGAPVVRIAEGLRFTEGPVWMPDGFLLFSDIPANTIHKWSAGEGLSEWRKPSHNSNGNTVDLEGRLVTCEHGSRTVTRTGKDGSVTTLARTFGGKRLNSPNDIVVKSDGTLWFTDPPYGIRPKMSEQPANHVFRLDPGAKEPVAVASDFPRPNGLCFSPDEKLIYVADSHKPTHHVRRFSVKDDNTLSGGEVFVTITPHVPDGMRCDEQGRLFVTAGDGVQVYSPGGELLGRFRTPKPAANCCFGGPDGRTLYITANDSVWSVETQVRGAGPGRAP
ncbi:MAG: SMP-30/gluconolactonase/LRE family protein [Planctomycetota bacterium]|jgi:gluconolactonase